MEATPITMAKSTNIFCCPLTKSQAPQPSTQAFPTNGNSNKNVKNKKTCALLIKD
jgi:hypothetical protein